MTATPIPDDAAGCRDSREPGRVCPAEYRTDVAGLARDAEIAAQTLYVVGGLYGNPFALDAIEALAAAEPWPPTLVFNGDAHWFDADTEMFAALEARLAAHAAVAGNVELELARGVDVGAGCGCAYPPSVPDDVVARSNAILVALRGAASSSARTRFTRLPKTLIASVGASRIGIVHGDPTAVAGWRFARGSLDDRGTWPWLDAIKQASRIDIFASTHTCEAVMRDLSLASGRLIVANNGAAGMANFDRDPRGLLTRISTRPSPHAALYGLKAGGVYVDALPIAFDLEAFIAAFDAIWPTGSPAEISYRRRIQGETTGFDPRLAAPSRTDPRRAGLRQGAGGPAARGKEWR
jgi:hypothetical protein